MLAFLFNFIIKRTSCNLKAYNPIYTNSKNTTRSCTINLT